MKHIIFLITFYGLAQVPFAGSVSAGTLKINLSALATTYEDRVDLLVSVSNLGTATAHRITLELQSADTIMHAAPAKILLPHKTFDHLFSFPNRLLNPGNFPYQVKCRYTDLNGQPLSAVLASTYAFGKTADDLPLAIMLDTVEIGRFSKLNCSLENLSGRNLSISYFFIMPDGFQVVPPGGQVDLEAHQKKYFRFALTNNTSIAGATYPIYFVIENDTPNGHYTLVKESRINVSASLNENWFVRHRWKLFLGFFISLSVAILFGFFSRLKRNAISIGSSCR